ncbi:MAG: hypothetical protein H0V96_10255 [Acidimicrobiia bacterium]|nr:hypothetical protein [Acidimicrobiia bacterium]
MNKHPFDAISFFFGLVFTVGAVSALVSGADPWPFDRAGVWPVLLIVGGVVMLVASLRRDRSSEAQETVDDAATANIRDGCSATDDTVIDDTTDPALIAARREIGEIGPGTPDDAA